MDPFVCAWHSVWGHGEQNRWVNHCSLRFSQPAMCWIVISYAVVPVLIWSNLIHAVNWNVYFLRLGSYWRLWHRESQSSYRGSPDSVTDWSMWDLWWTHWHWDRVSVRVFGFSLSVPFHQWCILIHLSQTLFKIESWQRRLNNMHTYSGVVLYVSIEAMLLCKENGTVTTIVGSQNHCYCQSNCSVKLIMLLNLK